MTQQNPNADEARNRAWQNSIAAALNTPERLERIEAERETDVFWPPGDVMDMMIEAVEHLLDKHDCDGPKHEEFLHALRQSRDHRRQILEREFPQEGK